MALAFEVTHNVGAAQRAFTDIGRQIPFATAKAINATATDFQEVERARIKQRFTLRRERFILRTVKINRGDFATKRKLFATVQIDKDRDFLAKFEKGGQKRSQRGRSVAVPIAVKRTKTGIVSRRNRPRAYHFRRVGGREVGRARTFIVRGGKSPGIYQRTGRKRRGVVRLLYLFRRSVTIDPRLKFVDTAKSVVSRRWERNFEQAFEQAVRTAR